MSDYLQSALGTSAYDMVFARLQEKMLERFQGKLRASNLALSGQAGRPIDSDGRYLPLGSGATEQSAFDGLIEDASQRYGIDPDLVRALIKVESNFNPEAVSHAGAKGLMQLMDGTAASLGVENSFDVAQNIEGGVSYLAQQLQRFQGDTRLALAAYNAGPGAVMRHGGIPPYQETQNYVTRVLSYYGGPRIDYAA